MEQYRKLYVYADGDQIDETLRVICRGKSTMTCLPDQWQVDIINPESQDIARLKRANAIKVTNQNGSPILTGKPFDFISREDNNKKILTMLLLNGEAFWTACVAFSVASGATVEQIVTKALEPSETKLGEFPADSTIFSRGVVYYGRSVDVVSDMVRAIHCRAFTFEDSLYVVQKGVGQESHTLNEDSVHDFPTALNSLITVQTDVAGYMPGQIIKLDYEGYSGKYRVMAVTVDADTQGSMWNCTLTLMDESTIDLIDWEGIG